MTRADPPVTLREARDSLRRDLPGQVRFWLLIGVLIALVVGVAGRYSWPEAVVIGISFLPFAIPLGPLMWLYPFGSGSGLLFRRGGWRLLGLFVGWAGVTFLPAAILAFGILRLGGLR